MPTILASRPLIVNPPAEGKARPRFEVGDVFRLYGDDFRKQPITRHQLKVMRAIEACRTAQLGGHLEACACGFSRPVYNSCRDRHCPKCQKLATTEWMAARREELLPVGYFHNVFTLPHEINPLAAVNPRFVYAQLFRSVAAVLQSFAADPKYGLGGTPGFTSVLHTWDQQLQYHVHLHCIIAGGALAFDGSRWINANPKYLFPIGALAAAYRQHFLTALARAHRCGELLLPGTLAEPGRFAELLACLEGKNWVCFERAPFDHTGHVLEYLSRYTHRVAISNQRILDISGGRVTFAYRDRKDHNRRKEMTLSAVEFIRRFLLHVTPARMPRMRHYGIISNRRKPDLLPRCRTLFGLPELEKKALPTQQVALLLDLTGIDVTLCPHCGGKMTFTKEIPRPLRRVFGAMPPRAAAADTS